MEWFKFYGGAYLSDPKMLMLTACERSCWLTLLAYASVSENGGKIKYLTEQQLMIAAGVSPMHEEWDITVGVLAKFEGLGMISFERDEIEVLNWCKRQERYLSNAERQRKYREKVKSNASVTTPLQQSNARIEKNRIEEDIYEVSDSEIPPKKERTNLEGWATFLAAYPKQEDGARASAEWRRMGKDERQLALADVLKRNSLHQWSEEYKFIPTPKSYLEGKRWNDKPKEQEAIKSYGKSK